MSYRMELSSGINAVIPDYATLRVLADEKDTVVANNVRIAPDGEGFPNFMVLYKKRYIARGEAAGADYRVVHVLEWVIMRSDPKYFEDVPTARYVMTLGETSYANPSAPFVAYRKISEEETENDYVKTYGDPKHVLHAIRQNLEDVAGDNHMKFEMFSMCTRTVRPSVSVIFTLRRPIRYHHSTTPGITDGTEITEPTPLKLLLWRSIGARLRPIAVRRTIPLP